MTDQPTPDKFKAFLDDLARISFQHGVCFQHEFDGDIFLGDILEGFRGYSTSRWNDFGFIGEHGMELENGATHSIDLTQLSAHERLAIMRGKD